MREALKTRLPLQACDWKEQEVWRSLKTGRPFTLAGAEIARLIEVGDGEVALLHAQDRDRPTEVTITLLDVAMLNDAIARGEVAPLAAVPAVGAPIGTGEAARRAIEEAASAYWTMPGVTLREAHRRAVAYYDAIVATAAAPAARTDDAARPTRARVAREVRDRDCSFLRERWIQAAAMADAGAAA